jgi:YesN/AraC family two-component response regulator
MYKLLIVDDERLIRERLKFVLKTINLPLELVGEAKNGEEALVLLSEKSPDIVITDIRMPVMDGIELVKQAKLRHENAKFIIISGYAEFDYAREALAAGVIDYVLRPVESMGLSKSLQKACNEVERIKKTDMDLKVKNELEARNAGQAIENYLNELIFLDESDPTSCRNLVTSCPELKKDWYTLIIFHISHPKTLKSQFQENDFNLVRFSIDNIIREIGKSRNVIIFNNTRDRAEILALCHDPTEHAVIRECMAFANYCFINVDQFLHSALTVGISNNHNSLSQLSECYRQAKHALMQRFAQGSNKIFNYTDVISCRKTKNNLSEPKLQTLDVCLQSINSYNSLKNVRNIISSIFFDAGLQGANTEDIQILFG